MKSTIFITLFLFLFLSCYDNVEFEERCYNGEEEGCILYNGGCFDDLVELKSIYYSRCCDGKYTYYKYEDKIYYSIKEMKDIECK